MPKERIENAAFRKGEPYTQVSWGRGTYVQMGILTQQLTSEAPTEQALFSDLDREGINTLIRTLRKARDQAFGRDE